MNGFSREAFRAWWEKEGDSFACFADQGYTASRAWEAALEWSARQQHLLDELSDPDPCAGGFCPVELFRPIDETEGSN